MYVHFIPSIFTEFIITSGSLFWILFWRCWVFTVAHRFSLVSESGDYSLVVVRRLSLWCLVLLQSAGSGAGAAVAATHGSVSAAPGLWSTGSLVGAHRLICSSACGVFLDKLNSCLLHCLEKILYSATREAPLWILNRIISPVNRKLYFFLSLWIPFICFSCLKSSG